MGKLALGILIFAAVFFAAFFLFHGKTAPEGDIAIYAPSAGEAISSPLKVSGKARGTWFFEAAFPVRVLDEDGTVLGRNPTHATGDWMTSGYVPFEGMVEFSAPHGTHGTVVFAKDNPSGLPEHDASVTIPITFQQPRFGK